MLKHILKYLIFLLSVMLAMNVIAGNNNNNNNPAQSVHKVDICHVPPGNINNGQDLNIDVSGIHGHQNHPYDHIGKCAGPNSSSEDLFIVYNCQDHPTIANNDYRTEFVGTLIDYNEPIVLKAPYKVPSANINNNAANFSVVNVEWEVATEAILSKLSDCMDTSKGNAKVAETSDKELSIVMGCKSLAVTEAYKHEITTEAENNFNFDYTVIPDGALNDPTVKSQYDACLTEDSDYLIYQQNTEDGNNFRIVSGCSNLSDLQNAVDAYYDAIIANPNYPIILTASSLDDYEVAAAYDACCDASKGKATCVKQYGNGPQGRQGFRELFE